MRSLVACVLLLAPLPACLAADNDRSDLKALYDAHRWFDLRNSVQRGNAPLFYQGAVACAFNDLRTCEKDLATVIKSEPHSKNALEAHRLLGAAYFRTGKYRKALVHVDAILAVRPDDSDVKDDRPLLAALRNSADQSVVRRTSTTLELEDAGLPVEVNGVQGRYWFDTGADVSALSESDAKRFNLHVLDAPIKEGDVTGAEVDSRIAVADALSIGSVRLSHVAFLVFSDNQPPFNQLPPGSRGVIGLPVLLALQSFAWRDKKFEIDAKARSGNANQPNLCFNEHSPVVLIQFEKHNLALTLDTGATNTDLYPPFAALFPDLIRNASRNESYKMEGVGGAKNMNAAVLGSLHMIIGGFPVTLKPANVLLTHTKDDSHYYQGNLGIDLLQQAHETIFNFKAMTLALR